MQVLTSLDSLAEITPPVFLTIGNFDGVHLGHAAILKNLQESAKKEGVGSLVITFSNHPLQILRPNHPTPLLTSKEHKIQLLENFKLDYVLVIPFTHSFSHQSAELFLRDVYKKIPFRRLVLGADAKLGNDRQGNTPLLHALAYDLHFTLEFLPLEMANDAPITSSRIRQAVQCAELKAASALLGRKFSLILSNERAIEGLCHPPFGVYAVTVNGLYRAVAHLSPHTPLKLIEIDPIPSEPHPIEVTFEEFLRPERTFDSQEAFQKQLNIDMNQAKHFLSSSPQSH